MTNSVRLRRAACVLISAVLLVLLFSYPRIGTYSVFGHSGTLLQGFTTAPPTVDGVIGAAEWASAGTFSFSMTGSGGTVYSVTILVMNDFANLYLAVRINDDELGAGSSDAAVFQFDNDHGGESALEVGDDRLRCSSSASGEDRFWDGSAFLSDSSDGAQENIACGASHVGANNEFEMSHPICVGGNGDFANGRVHDICLALGGPPVGFLFQYRDGQGAGGSSEFGTSPPLANPADTTVANPGVFHEIKAVQPDFSISSSTGAISVTQGSSMGAMITVLSLQSFSSAVALTVSWVGVAPSDVTLILPSPITPPAGSTASSPLTVNAGMTASTGVFMLRVLGTSGALSHFVEITVQIAAAATTTTTSPTGIATTTGPTPDFSVASLTPLLSVTQGGTGSATITVTSINGFSSAVTLTTSWLGAAPSDVNLALPSPVTPVLGGTASSPLMVGAGPSATIGTFTLRVIGVSGSLSHSIDITVQISAAGTTTTATTTSPAGAPRCLIATAAFGSELSPEVQFLRSFRDNSILKTYAGSNFMVAFNAWYYSFSPNVAQFIAEHSMARTGMKLLLYPLIGILSAGAVTFNLFSANPEVAALTTGLLVSSLIGATYVGLPLTIMLAGTTRGRRIAKRLERPVTLLLLSATVLVFVAEFSGSAFLMILATTTVVTSTLAYSALATSRTILHLVKPL